MKREIATLLAALGLLAVVPATAQAKDDIYLQVWPPAPQVNTQVGVSLVGCRTPTVATSPGFVSPVRMEPVEYGIEGVVKVVDKAGSYTALSLGGEAVGGLAELPAEVPGEVPAHWVTYFAVADADESTEKVRELGGSVLNPPFDSPDGRLAAVTDNQGVSFCLVGPSAG